MNSDLGRKFIFHKVSKYLVNHFGKKVCWKTSCLPFLFSLFFLVESILRKELFGDKLNTGKYMVVMMITILPWYKDLTKTWPLLLKIFITSWGKLKLGFKTVSGISVLIRHENPHGIMMFWAEKGQHWVWGVRYGSKDGWCGGASVYRPRFIINTRVSKWY